MTEVSFFKVYFGVLWEGSNVCASADFVIGACLQAKCQLSCITTIRFSTAG